MIATCTDINIRLVEHLLQPRASAVQEVGHGGGDTTGAEDLSSGSGWVGLESPSVSAWQPTGLTERVPLW